MPRDRESAEALPPIPPPRPPRRPQADGSDAPVADSAVAEPDSGPPFARRKSCQPIADAPALAPVDGGDSTPPADAGAPLDDIETVAARRARRLAEQRRRYGPPQR